MSLPAPDRTRNPSRRGPWIATILVLATFASGCSTMWDRVRERERMFALEAARTETRRGQCQRALESLDRAEARLDLGAYAREATLARIRCYEKLGMSEIARANRRLVDDFYSAEPMAYPDEAGGSVFRVKSIEPGGFERPPGWLKIAPPRYTPYAQRSKIVGRVVIAFELAGNDRPRKIRVLEMPHPLLASWAIEAVALAESKKKKDSPVLLPGGQYITTFLFEWRWAREEQTNPLDS